MLNTGDKAIDFTLKSESDTSITLSDYFGKSNIVLFFYPKDNTPGCTKEACGFRDNLENIQAKDTIVLGISPDSIKSHQNFIAKQNLNFTLLSDPQHEVAESYGAWGENSLYGRKYMGVIRSTFIIGKDGLIKKSFYKVKVTGHVDEVVACLDAL